MLELEASPPQAAVFLDRRQAGEHLAGLLGQMPWNDPLVLAIPKGGVPVAREIALRLGAPLELILVRKLSLPENPGLTFGALSESGALVLNEPVLQEFGLGLERVNEAVAEGLHLLERRLVFYRPGHRLPPLQGRSVILVDDFADTSYSALAALARIRTEKPRDVTLALPVLAKDSAHELRRKVDNLVCLCAPQSAGSPGDWYVDARRASDEEVLQLLQSHDALYPRSSTDR